MMWMTASDLAGLPGMPESGRHVLRRAQAENWRSRPRTGRGRTGCEYLVADLPTATQQALAASAVAAVRPAARAQEASIQLARNAQVQAHAAAMARLGVTLEAAGGFDPAVNPRLDLFQRFERYHMHRAGAVWPAIVEFVALWGVGQIEALDGTRKAYPTLPAKTLDKWYRDWRVNGVQALLERKPRKDKGNTQLDQDDELRAVFVSALLEMHEPTASQVQRVIKSQVGDARTPPTSTLKRWMREFKSLNKVALLKLKNPDAWRNKYMPAFGSRSEHITAVNEEWQLDSTIADAQQRVEIAFNLQDEATGEIRRHALVAGIDVLTRRAKVFVSRTSSSNAVKTLVRSVILDYGMVNRFKTDNGKDYTADDFEFALRALKIDHKLCTPFSPDQKPFIERFLGTLLHDLFPMLEGFVGHDVATRKAIDASLSFAQRFGQDGIRLRMTPERLQAVINAWLVEYHGRHHSTLGCSPNEMAERHSSRVLRVDERALDLFLMPVAGNGVRTVKKEGIKMPLNDRAGSAWYRAPELAAVNVMGQQVYCRIDEADIGAMHVFHLDGAYICRALDYARLGINKAELAAKAHAIEKATIAPVIAEFRKARRKNLTQQAVDAIYSDRIDTVTAAGSTVARLPVRPNVSTPAIEAFIESTSSAQLDAARAEAKAAFADPSNEAPVIRMDTPKQRYSAWVRLAARAGAGEQLASRDADWMHSYEGSNEFQGFHALHEGHDPLAEAAG
jgi:putative transposase